MRKVILSCISFIFALIAPYFLMTYLGLDIDKLIKFILALLWCCFLVKFFRLTKIYKEIRLLKVNRKKEILIHYLKITIKESDKTLLNYALNIILSVLLIMAGFIFTGIVSIIFTSESFVIKYFLNKELNSLNKA